MTVPKNQMVKEAVEALGIDAPSKDIREYAKEKYGTEIADPYIYTIRNKLRNVPSETTFSPELLRSARQFVLACGNKQTALAVVEKVATETQTVQKSIDLFVGRINQATEALKTATPEEKTTLQKRIEGWQANINSLKDDEFAA